MINPHVLKMELTRSWKSLLAWSISIGLFLYFVIIIYPLVKDLYANIPAEVAEIFKAFGGVPENEIDYFAMECGLLLAIFGAIFAALAGFNFISREERESTIDTVYTLPISRSTFFFSKLLAIIIHVLLFSIIITPFIIFGFLTINSNINLLGLFVYLILFTLMMIMIACLSFSFACFKNQASKNSISLIIPLPLYLITMVSSLSNEKFLKNIKYLSPFTFSDSTTILIKEEFEYISFTVSSIFSIVLLVIAFIRFQKKELYN